MWKEHGDESVLDSKGKYDNFLKDSQRVSFVRFRDLHEANQSIPVKYVLAYLGIKRLSRKGFYISKRTEEEFMALMG
jgi:hypothetical protein